MAELVPKGTRPLRAPRGLVFGVGGPVQLFVQLVGNVVELERRVPAVPAEDTQCRQIAVVLVKMGKGDFARVGGFIAESRNEKKIVGVPRGLVGLFCRGAFLDDKMAQDAAQDDDGEFLFLELDEENAPRLAGRKRAELVNFLDGDGVLVFQTEFGGNIFKRNVVEAARLDRPFKFGFQIADEIGKLADGSEWVGHKSI
jgi:hypothetical protein